MLCALYTIHMLVSAILSFPLWLIHSRTRTHAHNLLPFQYLHCFFFLFIFMKIYIVSSFISLLFSHWIAVTAVAVAVAATVAVAYLLIHSIPCAQRWKVCSFTIMPLSSRTEISSLNHIRERNTLANCLYSYFFKFCVHVLTFCKRVYATQIALYFNRTCW